MSSVLLVDGNIITHSGEILRNKNILIKDGLISYIGEDKFQADTIYDCKDKYISPSFTNLHTHSSMNIFKGFAEDVDIDSWFNDIIWPYEDKLIEEDIYHGCRIAVAELIQYGVSAFADHYLYASSIIKAALDIGIRIDMAPTLFSLTGNLDRELESTLELVDKYKDNGNVVISFGPHSPYTCTFEDLKIVADFAEKFNLKVHIHVAETKDQVEDSLKNKGITPIEELYKAGILKARTILAHSLYIRGEDLKYLNKDTNIILSPKTYLKLNMGLGNVFKYKDTINISIGSDGAASSNSLSPIEQVRLLGLLGKHILADASSYEVNDLWKYLMKGHEILDFNSGKVEEGYMGDLIIWDLELPNTSLNNNVLSSIIYSSDSSNIDSVLVGGKFLKKEKMLTFSVTGSINYCKKRIDNLLKEGGGKTKLKF